MDSSAGIQTKPTVSTVGTPAIRVSVSRSRGDRRRGLLRMRVGGVLSSAVMRFLDAVQGSRTE
ncbi:hypothetical protein GCM10010442_39020 [Kitasatospora kifunensis]